MEGMSAVIQRSASLTWAAVLLLLIGGSGIAVGASFLGAAGSGPVLGVDIRSAALGLAAGIGGYGLAAFVAGVGLFRLRRWAWWLGVAVAAIGLVVLGFALQAAGADLIIGFGVALWGLVLALLLAPATRQAVNAAPRPR